MFGCKGDDRKRRKGGKSKGREREEERVVHRRIVLIQFLWKKGLFWKNNGTVWRIVLRKFLKHKLYSRLWVVRKVWNFIKKEKKYEILVNRSNCVFSLFNRKLKSENAWDHHSIYWIIDIEKLNERGKKRLNTKLERHLTRSHVLLHNISTFIYIYIYIDW